MVEAKGDEMTRWVPLSGLKVIPANVHIEYRWVTSRRGK